jgi:hypothetical protein
LSHLAALPGQSTAVLQLESQIDEAAPQFGAPEGAARHSVFAEMAVQSLGASQVRVQTSHTQASPVPHPPSQPWRKCDSL